MPLPPNSKLGPYEILTPLGAGGMGEVYRARDPRLGREVAIKVLPPQVAADPERVLRFEQEARSASALNHPSIVTIHEFGRIDSTSYIVMELVEGVSLRQRLAEGPVAPRKAVAIAVQIADALAKAHAAGIVHRDLKPENIMVSKDGFAKILDFGLAKLVGSASGNDSQMETLQQTNPGTVLGTVLYMSPEQAGGRVVDFRSDQFSFGAILYEMLTGKKAFQHATSAEIMTSIIRDDPEPIASLNPQVPAPVRWIVERCLAKDPEERYLNTRDLARDLQSIHEHFSEMSSGSREQSAIVAPPVRGRSFYQWVGILGILSAVLLGAALLFQIRKNKNQTTAIPSYHRLTYQRGNIETARFVPDGHTIIYSAAWQGNPREMFLTRSQGVGSQPLSIPKAEVLSISSTGDMLVLIPYGNRRGGTLAQVPMTGGVPRPLSENVLSGDWSPDGTKQAVVRAQSNKISIEYPAGKTLYETSSFIRSVRVSPNGDLIAFSEHPVENGSEGWVFIMDLKGIKKAKSSYAYPLGIAWTAKGDEVWFSTFSSETGGGTMLRALTTDGRDRLIQNLAGPTRLQDISKQGDSLMTFNDDRVAMVALPPGETKERDLSWLDYSEVEDLSKDGQTLLFGERGDGAEAHGTAFYRKMDGSPAVRLGPGIGFALSPDGRSVVGADGPGDSTVVFPTGAGEKRPLVFGFDDVGWQRWMPDGNRFIFYAREKDRDWRLYISDLSGKKPVPFTPEGVAPLYSWTVTISPDGKFVIAVGKDQKVYRYPIDGGQPILISGLTTEEEPFQWSADGQSIYVYRHGELPARVFQVDVATGQRKLFKELMPSDPSGVTEIENLRFTPDAKSYAYSYERVLSTLYIVSGF